MRILGVERDDTACGYYRLLVPLLKLKDLGLADTMVIAQEDELKSERSYQKVMESDIILLPRPQSEEWFNFINSVRKLGKIVVVDYDDDPFSTSPFNPYYRWIGVEEWRYKWEDGDEEWIWKDGMKDMDGFESFNIEKNIGRRDMLRAAFKKADLVTCTTPILAEVFQKINPNVAVLPNLIDFSFYPKAELMKKEIRIGWQGGISHYEDLHMIKPVLAEVAKKNPDTKFIFFGDSRFNGLFSEVKNFQHESFVDHKVYPYKLALMNFDIGICPLVDNKFNRNKSAIKYFEYSVIGVPTIASNVTPYKEVIKSGVDGLLIENNQTEWVEAIQMLIDSKDMRQRLAKNAYENVYENFNADKHIHLWKDAYEALIKKEAAFA